MFSKEVLKYCCENISNIENYQEALKDDEFWEVHHRFETHDENGNWLDKRLSKKELISKGLYFNRPSSELIFMPRQKHRFLHMGRNQYAKGMNKGNQYAKGVNIGNQYAKGNVLSEKTRKQMGESRKGNTNNGIALIKCIETDEIHRTREWISLGFPNAYNVAKGRQKTCHGYHFVYV